MAEGAVPHSAAGLPSAPALTHVLKPARKRSPLRQVPGLRALAYFWGAVVLTVGGGVTVLHVLGPPEMRTVAIAPDRTAGAGDAAHAGVLDPSALPGLSAAVTDVGPMEAGMAWESRDGGGSSPGERRPRRCRGPARPDGGSRRRMPLTFRHQRGTRCWVRLRGMSPRGRRPRPAVELLMAATRLRLCLRRTCRSTWLCPSILRHCPPLWPSCRTYLPPKQGRSGATPA